MLEINGDINNKINWEKDNITKLGIDEHSFKGKKLLITITDLSNKRLLAILKGDSQIYLEEFFEKEYQKNTKNK